MPIYTYRCASCGLQEDFLVKFSDPVPDKLLACGGTGCSLEKVISKGTDFRLRGQGWYETDFKDTASEKQRRTDFAG